MGKQYEMAFQIGAKVQGNFSAAFKNAASSVKGLQTQIDSLNKKQGDITSYQKTQTALEKTRQKLQLYQQQYANLKAEMDRNGQASAAEQNALLAKGKAIDDLKDKQAQLEQRLQSTGAALEKEGVDLNNLAEASQQTGQDIDQLKQKQIELADASEQSGNRMAQALNDASAAFASLGIIEGLKKVQEGFQQCAQEAIAFEAEMAAVRRTTGGSADYIGDLGESFKDISTEIPIATSELAQIAAAAGQLGISTDNIEQFTVVMAKLATTTDLTADEAATMLAQFANITGLTDYERMGAVVAQLGDSTATTASKVVQMSQGMAAAANIAGMSATDIMAISAAVGSLGIEAQAGSTAMSQLITTLYKATETGENLSEFAAVAGMSADQFKQAWGADAVGAMNAFVTGLNDVERNGRSAIVILDELGINNVRQQKAILGLASAGNLLTNTITQANQAWAENTALEEKAGIMYDTTQAKLTMMNNAFNNLKIAIGDAFTPVISQASEALTGILKPVTEYIEQNPALVKAIGAAVAVIGVAAAGLAAYTVAAKLAAAATAALSTAFPAFLAITAGIAAIAGVVAYLSDYSSAAEEAAAETVNLQEQFAELQSGIEHDNHIISLCEDYKKLTKQSDYAIDNLKDMEGFSDLKISATADATIDPNDFLLPGVVISTSSLVDGKPVTITGTPGEDLLEDDELVKKTGITLTANSPDDEHKLEASAFVNGQLIEFTASWANRAEFEEDVENLKKQAEIAKKDLTEAQTVYDHLKEYRDQLLSRKKFAGSESEKDSLSAQLAEVNEQITAQEEELGRLQTAYEEAGGRYVIAANAAGTLAEKEQRLAAIQAELGVSSDGIADNIDDQTTAIWGQVDAIEAETRALREQKRIEFYNNVGSKSMTYWRKAVGANSNNDISTSYRSVGGAQQYAQFTSEMANYAGTFNGKSVAEYNQELSNVTHRLDDYYAHGNTNSPAFAEDVKKLYALRMMRSTGDVTFDAQVNRPNGYKTFATEGTDAWLKSIGADQAGFSFVNTFNTPQVGDSLSGGIAAAYQVSRDAQTWYEEIQAEQDAYIQSLVDSVSQGAISIEDCDKAVTAALADQEQGAEVATEIMNQVRGRLDELEAAQNGTAQAAEGSAAAVTQAVQPIIDQMNELSEAYTQAYDAAYKSISGQFSLFEEMEQAKPGEKGVDDYIAALQSQQAYMEQYTQNLQAVKDMGLSSAMIAELSDGSKESAEILSTIVAQGATKIDELNDAYAGVEQGKEAFADTVAEMETDFTEKMKGLEEQLNATVRSMNQSDEAAKAGADTMQAFADAAAAKQSTVESAFEKVRNAAIRKLMGGFNFPGFAGGTDNAPQGFAMVGEHGPELVYLNGGEKILDAQETQRTMEAMSLNPVNAMSASGGGSGYVIDFKPQINITGSGDPEAMRSYVEDQMLNMRDQLEDMINDIENDRARRSYA